MRQILGILSIVVGVGIVAPAVAAAQVSTGQISGRVTDASGAVLPGVTVTATQTETQFVRTTVTNEVGAFTLPNLPVGPYRLEASLQGFRTFVQSGITLQVNANLVVDPVAAARRHRRDRSPCRRGRPTSRSRRAAWASAPWSNRSASSSCRSTRGRSPT